MVVLEKIKKQLNEFVDANKDEGVIKCVGAFPVAMCILFLLTSIFPKLHCRETVVLELIFMLASYFIYAILSPHMDDGKKKKCQNIIKVAVLIFLFYTISLGIRKLGSNEGHEALLKLVFPSGLLSFVIWIGLITSELPEKAFEYSSNINLSEGEKSKEPELGDIVLCRNFEKMEENAPDPREIIPFKDRFLHMLILGATGTGKTSQILIPMIHQDIQNLDCGVIVLEPKGDLAQKIAMMAEVYGRKAKYFDPAMSNCPCFNPLHGREIDVVENMATTFRMLNPDSPTFFLDLSEQLVKNAVKVLKRLDRHHETPGKYSTLLELSRLVQNTESKGTKLIQEFAKVTPLSESEGKENSDIQSWFLTDYFAEKSKTYENTSGVRSQLSKICSNEFLRDVLNPDYDKGQKNEIDFDKSLADGEVLCLSTAQGILRDLSRFLGYFVILQLQSAVFRRPGSENTRRANFLYIDEFQVYSTPGFADMLTMGRSYRVASHLATQARAQMAMGGGKDGDNFVTLVSTNARNVVLFPGCSGDDARYYSQQFGEKEETEVQVGITRKKFSITQGGFDKLGHPSESIRETKKLVPVFTPTDLIYRNFGDIIYCIIKNNSIQIPQVGKVSYIPKELNEELDVMVAKYLEEYTKKTEEEQREIDKQKKAELERDGIDMDSTDHFFQSEDDTSKENSVNDTVEIDSGEYCFEDDEF